MTVGVVRWPAVAFRRLLAATGRAVLRANARGSDGLVGLDAVIRVRKLIPGPVGLEPPTRTTIFAGDDPVLASTLSTETVGGWAIGANALELLVETIRSLRPSTVLEFGSGVSTLAIAAVLRDLGNKGAHLTSIEQDPVWVEATRAKLRERALGEWAEVVHAPLITDPMGSQSQYDIPEATLRVLAKDPPALVFVDGPAASSGSRTHTLSIILPLLAEAQVMLDDAWRDSELETALSWSDLPRVHVRGLWPHEKGMLMCEIRGPSRGAVVE